MVDLSARHRREPKPAERYDRFSVAVIVLAFNEEESLPGMLRESVDWLAASIARWELIVVDDGSKDGTRAVAERFAAEDPRVRVVSHETNRGMGAGMKTGIRAATCDYFTIIAGDGQHPTPELAVMLPGLEEAEIVTTYHRNAREPHRRVLSWGFRQAMKWACGIDFTLEGIYLFPRKVAVEEIGLENVPPDTFFFSFELIARALQRGHTITVRPMLVRPREHGQSKVANVNRIKRIGREILDFRTRLEAERGRRKR